MVLYLQQLCQASRVIIKMSDSFDFQILDSLHERSRQQQNQAAVKIYEVKIKASKNKVDLNLLENQYYDFQLYQYNQKILSVQRRYSQFALIYEILSKKQPGYIFPAFPENGIFAFMKTKVTISKDQAFINTRIKVIERFFNKLFNGQEFSPKHSSEIKEFISEGKAFQARRQIEKGGSGFGGWGWGKVKNFFAISKENKYKEHEEKIMELKAQFEFLYTKCQELIQLMNEEKAENAKIQELADNNNYLLAYRQFIKTHDLAQQSNISELQSLQFSLFCENEDLLMAKKIIDRMNELKNDEDNYAQLKKTQQKFSSKIDHFLTQKAKSKAQHEQSLSDITKHIKQVSRFS